MVEDEGTLRKDQAKECRSRGGPKLFNRIQKMQSEEVLLSYFLHLKDYKTVVMCSKVCRLWNSVSKTDQLWVATCNDMWADKVYIPEKFVALKAAGKGFEAFVGALQDSKRSLITREEMSAIPFYFRFKEVAGSYWTDQDPFWKNLDPLRIRFTADGKVVGFPWDVLENCWVLYFSFPIPPRGSDESLEDKFLDDLMNDEQWSEALAYNSGNPLPVEEEEAEPDI